MGFEKSTKFIYALLGVFFLSFLSACMEQVCLPGYDYYLRGVTVQATDKVLNDDGVEQTVYRDSIQSKLVFEVTADIEIAANTPQPYHFGLMNSAYASGEVGTPLNFILPTNTKIYTDVPLTTSLGRILRPSTNLLAVPSETPLFEVPQTLNYGEETLIIFNAEGLNLEKGDYTFYFEWTTDDDKLLADDVTVYLDF